MSAKNEFRILGRREGNEESIRFSYRGVDFHQDCFHVVAGLNAVDTRCTPSRPCARGGLRSTRCR